MRTSRFAATVLVLALAACNKGSDTRTRPGEATPADVIAGTVTAFEHFESASGHFAMELPSEWRGNFTVSEHADSVAGSHYVVEFIYRPLPGSKERPRTLLAVRLFATGAWDKLVLLPDTPPAAKVAAKGNVVYAVSLPAGNPYPKGSPDAAQFDKMVLGVAQDPGGFRLTPR
jgi:hypothetical protein